MKIPEVATASKRYFAKSQTIVTHSYCIKTMRKGCLLHAARDAMPVLSVEAATGQACGSRDEGIPITKSSGYLANSVTAETNKGSSACPWVLQGQPGQRFSLSLIDYGSSSVEDLIQQLPG